MNVHHGVRRTAQILIMFQISTYFILFQRIQPNISLVFKTFRQLDTVRAFFESKIAKSQMYYLT